MNKIIVKGARVHNLKNIDVEIPKNKLVVITGISGSGKSSLAFDTIYAEGQRKYVESLSAYARQFLEVMGKPDVDKIEGLSPAIAIDQKAVSKNPRSTVGTITEIYDYLRLLFARCGHPHCPKCGREVARQTIKQILDQIKKLPQKTKFNILAPLIKDRKGEHKHILEEIQKAGYIRVRLDKKIYSIEEACDLEIDKKKKHSLDVVVDRLVLESKKEFETRLAESCEAALDLGNDILIVQDLDKKKDILFSSLHTCPKCGISLPELQPRLFSFNSPYGACPECSGLGIRLEVDPKLVIPNPRLTLAQGAIRPWVTQTSGKQGWYYRLLEALAKEHGFSMNRPVEKLSKGHLDLILYGKKGKPIQVAEFYTSFEGVIPNLERRYKETNSDYMRAEIEKYMRIKPCPTCKGRRLKPEALAVTVALKSISDVSALTVDKALSFFQELPQKLTEKEKKIAHLILKEIIHRLSFLCKVGLNYMTIDRPAGSLAGGEAQRIRLATQIGSGLSGVIYILDEPSIGLHQRDNTRLIETLKGLKDLANTVIVVEHDEQIINSADHIIDIGPQAGKKGGKVIAQGSPEQIKKEKTLTGLYLSHKKEIPLPKKYRKGTDKKLTIKGAEQFNLKRITVDIPLGKFICICGVSGSGKSTLMDEILAKALAQKFYHAKKEPGKHKEILGIENIDKVVTIDQSPIGRTPRSNPATYTGIFSYVRDLFAQVPEAKIRGYKPGRFSFNVKGGRCEACQGQGFIKVEMQFLPDVFVECDECRGKRFNKQTLEIHCKGKDIAEVLAMTVDEALPFFGNIPILKQKLQILKDVGLGYIQLGQPATTLSGGEAQRIKLATELSRRATGKTLYILDEPTTGLHFDDVKKLLNVLERLVDIGNTVLVIEHNLDVIKSCDWIIDLGPEGGDKGGYVVAEGTPRDIAKIKKSYTGQYLKKYFES